MNNRTQQLNQLFTDWEHSVEGYKGKFVRDGILNEELYIACPKKILFLMKEPNNPEQSAGDFREWWKEKISYTFSYRIAEWSYGLINDFPAYDKIWKTTDVAHKALQHVSLMNIKKIGGGGLSNFNEIDLHFENCKTYIQRQIEITSPDLIILGISFWTEIREKLFPKAKWSKSGYNIDIGKMGECKLIDFYHPSSRTPPSASYSLLQNIVKGEKFQSL